MISAEASSGLNEDKVVSDQRNILAPPPGGGVRLCGWVAPQCAAGSRPGTAVRMGGGGQLTEPGGGRAGGFYTWEEVQSHSSRNDQWLVIDRKVYNISQWAKRHPGGFRVISHYAGEDATAAIIQDFHTLRAQAEREGLFQARPLFFCLHMGHIVLLEVLAWLMLWHWGTNWILTLLCAVMLATAQSQAGWLQHDFGHLSVFKKSRWNHLLHKFAIGHLKGASANWWNHRHFQHHAKPNIFRKDPDVNMLSIFVVGATQPYGIKKIKVMPYHRQHQYFFLVGPPLLIPVFFHIQIMHTMISRHDWVDLVWSMSYYLRYFCCYVPLYGLFGSVALISFVRFLESHWFVWVTQMNHLPMDIDHENTRTG
ncbi:hypothetical protein INR49_010873 [Caranx melampygus]|nr:hypothetical protein INR49_010873 [Caranx melampygus]